MRAECHDDEDDSGEPIEPRIITRPRDRATVLADRVKRYGSALKQVISPMSEDPVERPAFFETYENVCHAFEVPDDLKPKLLLPFCVRRRGHSRHGCQSYSSMTMNMSKISS